MQLDANGNYEENPTTSGKRSPSYAAASNEQKPGLNDDIIHASDLIASAPRDSTQPGEKTSKSAHDSSDQRS